MRLELPLAGLLVKLTITIVSSPLDKIIQDFTRIFTKCGELECDLLYIMNDSPTSNFFFFFT